MSSIMQSTSFVHMIQVLFWGSFITATILLITYFTGNLSHPLTRAMKRTSKLRVNCLFLSSKIEDNEQGLQAKDVIKSLRKILKRRKSVLTSINVYIYDDNKKNLNQTAVMSALGRIEANCKESLSAVIENNMSYVKEKMDENAEIALDLYKDFKNVIMKETEDKLFDM